MVCLPFFLGGVYSKSSSDDYPDGRYFGKEMFLKFVLFDLEFTNASRI